MAEKNERKKFTAQRTKEAETKQLGVAVDQADAAVTVERNEEPKEEIQEEDSHEVLEYYAKARVLHHRLGPSKVR